MSVCQHCGRATDLKRLYALDDFSAITSWAKAINPLHTFHLRPKKQNKLICPKLQGPHFISPTQRGEVGNSSSNGALLPFLFQLVAAMLNVNRFWKYGLITYANEWKAVIKLSTEINGLNRGERHWAMPAGLNKQQQHSCNASGWNGTKWPVFMVIWTGLWPALISVLKCSLVSSYGCGAGLEPSSLFVCVFFLLFFFLHWLFEVPLLLKTRK